jgi:hypothetical protein
LRAQALQRAGVETGIQTCPSENREPKIWIPAFAEILMVQFILHWQFLLKQEIEFKIIEPGDRWSYPL